MVGATHQDAMDLGGMYEDLNATFARVRIAALQSA